MKETALKIKGMVCNRCIAAIEDLLAQTDLPVKKVSLGMIEFARPLGEFEIRSLIGKIRKLGFEIVSKRQASIVAKIKEMVQELVNGTQPMESLKFSTLFQEQFHFHYDTISAYFSEAEGITLEKYIVQQRLYKVQELLKDTNLTLSEIAFRLGYSSVNYLSAQFKNNTGLTPSHFRKIDIKDLA